MDTSTSPTSTRTIWVRRSLFTWTSFERILWRAHAEDSQTIREQAISRVTRLQVMTRFVVNYATGNPASGWPTSRCERTAPSTPDQVHACQMITTVHTVSIVAKNKYSGKAGGLPHPTSGGTKVRKPFTRVRRIPATIFATRFALNGSSRHATIMEIGISIKTAEPIRAHGARDPNEFGEPAIANSATTSAYR